MYITETLFSVQCGDTVALQAVVQLLTEHQQICLTCFLLSFPLLSTDNVFRYSNKVITKLPDISRFIAVFSYYRQRNTQRFCPINHSERAMQTLLCLAPLLPFFGLEINCWLIFTNGNENPLLEPQRDFLKKVFINGWIS